MGVVLDALPDISRRLPSRSDRRSSKRASAAGDRQRRGIGNRGDRRARPEHMRTGCPIVYTSADSVFQIAAHEGIVPVPSSTMCEWRTSWP